jgi:CrcB protein
MMLGELLLVAVAGGVGAACRFGVDSVIRARTGSAFPVGTVTINLTGSLLLGILAGWASAGLPPLVQAVAGTGFLGGYTTFSTALLETVRLLQQRRYPAALLNSLGSMVAAGLLSWLGLVLGRSLGRAFGL